VSDIAQHQSVVAKKCPLRHVSPPFNKFSSTFRKFPPKVLTNNLLDV
jgi:hypothetical protein